MEDRRSNLAPKESVAAVVQSLGKLESLNSLVDEFKYNKSFCQKVDELHKKGYIGWRRVRGDGNCFYRACGFGLLEQIITAPIKQQMAWAEVLRRCLESLRFEDREEQAEHLRLLDHVTQLSKGEGWQVCQDSRAEEMTQQGLLYVSFRDNSPASLDLALVRALRHLTARHMIANADDPEACHGISFRMLCDAQGLGTPERFCEQTVLPMGVEAETLVMSAIAPALCMSLRIALLDRGEASGLCFEDYKAGAGVDQPMVHVQLRPGHYDLLYWHDDSEDTLSPPVAGRGRPVTFGLDGGDVHWRVRETSDASVASSAASQVTLEPDLSSGYGYHFMGRR